MEDIHRPDKQGFIPFIHNYCDRRCERCRFVRQCRVGIIDVDDVDEERTGVAEDRVEDYAERLRKVMGLPAEDEEGDDEQGEGGWSLEIDEETGPDPDFEAERNAVREALKVHPFTERSLAYAELVSDWIDPREEVLREKGVTLHQRAELTVAPVLRTPEVIMLSEALEEVLWFQHMLYVKGQRAISGKLEDADDDLDLGLDPLQSDWNGTAKLLLHIVERSIGAWHEVAERWPEEAATVEPMIDLLRSCGAMARAEFPDAEKFVRPGFDAA